MNSVCESISRSILYVESAREIWIQLEKRFSLSNGSRKYRLNKDVYSIKQNGSSVSEYYTQIKGIWEELDSMIDLPKVSVANDEIANFLQAFGRMQEEQKLFQFLNGLDEVYKAQRSQILIMQPLPCVETACSVLQQEELQREVLDEEIHEASALCGKKHEALFSKGSEERCSHCGNKGHVKERYWQIIGYPTWHLKGKKQSQKKFFKNNSRSVQGRTAANVESASYKSSDGGLSLTTQQIEQLLKLLPNSSKASTESEDDDVEQSFAGNVYCSCAATRTTAWIIDTGATDHMTPMCTNLLHMQECKDHVNINLPDGSVARITHKGQVRLANDLVLKNTLCVPSFRFNLLSVSKLVEDNNCIAMFYPKFCLIQDFATRKLRGIGKQRGGLYYLVNGDLKSTDAKLSDVPVQVISDPVAVVQSASHSAGLVNNFPTATAEVVRDSCQLNKSDLFSVWHHRLGHAPVSKLKYINVVPAKVNDQVCITCPMSKMFALPFYQSTMATCSVFDLVHMDILGPYKIPTYKNHRFFLTLVDDFSRATWTYLLQHKSQAFTVLRQFYSYVYTQFDKKLKMIRSDNALEFTEGPCKEFFLEKGIIH